MLLCDWWLLGLHNLRVGVVKDGISLAIKPFSVQPVWGTDHLISLPLGWLHGHALGQLHDDLVHALVLNLALLNEVINLFLALVQLRIC